MQETVSDKYLISEAANSIESLPLTKKKRNH